MSDKAIAQDTRKPSLAKTPGAQRLILNQEYNNLALLAPLREDTRLRLKTAAVLSVVFLSGDMARLAP
jgi:hypothetical protein